ncbi:TIGR02444 family protein [Thioalkalivibrio sp. ALJ3]|uniref:TIGR02444 family protein n=1 Tax=Thioalkalivibrio sp. ALJ3 TaxID=1240557 RepID=UPI000477FE73|nr:TIGR02444 family protein [Thioalkalivibrio sp. ALJ3]
MPEAARPHDFDSFWDFSLRIWASAPARERLLRWQESYDVDVILALFALWYPGGIRTGDWEKLVKAAANWQEQTTSRVRALRRRLKPEGPRQPNRAALYAATKELEVACERTAALRLFQSAQNLGDPATTPNLTRRLRLLFPGLTVTEIRHGIPQLTQVGCT